MRIAIDSTVLYNTFTQGMWPTRALMAGVKSASYNMGTDVVPVV
jgi:hypothetical protein